MSLLLFLFFNASSCSPKPQHVMRALSVINCLNMRQQSSTGFMHDNVALSGLVSWTRFSRAPRELTVVDVGFSREAQAGAPERLQAQLRVPSWLRPKEVLKRWATTKVDEGERERGKGKREENTAASNADPAPSARARHGSIQSPPQPYKNRRGDIPRRYWTLRTLCRQR